MEKLKILQPVILASLLLFVSCSKKRSADSDEDFLREHVTWLADDEREGRLAGTIQEAEAANYIAKHFLQYGLQPAGDNGRYLQQFVLEGPMVEAMELENRVSRNVLGVIEGEKYPGRFIIIGAHYDGQGMGGPISMDMNGEPSLHNSADDNASGTAGLMYLARKFAENRPESNVLIAAFSGEEQGLIGSKYFVNKMEIAADSVLAMINLDMIGRLEENKLNIFGTGTSTRWEEILNSVESDSLEITTSPGGMGASDHASFYRAEIPVLHYYTGTHDQYHRETDTADLINYKGMIRVLEHIEGVIRRLDEISPEDMDFRESTDPHSETRMRSGVTLGVMPDYTYSDDGFRIDQVQPDGVADEAGFRDGDIIVEMDGTRVADIYDYMDVLNTLGSGDTVSVTILRNGEGLELEVTF